MLSHGGSVTRYLSSIGVNPKGIVVQRGRKNYAGPKCPGKGWTCTKSHRVLQFSTMGGTVNSVVCSASGGGGSVGSSSGSSSESCTIVQVSTSGSNSATCNEQSSSTLTGTMTQACSITQTSGSGSNTATVTQNVLQGPSSCSPPGTTSLQTTSGTQNATVTQSSASGAGTANVNQTLTQCVGTTSAVSVNESQITTQNFSIAQGPVGFNPGAPNCTNHGILKATAAQSQHQHASATAAGSGSQSQHADLNGHVDQCSIDHADYSATQSEDQSMDPNVHVAQTMVGPTKLSGGPARPQARRSLQKIGCCSFQGVNTTDFCTITQTTSQNGNPTPQATQTEDVSSSAGTTGHCTSNVSTNQNGAQFSNTQTGPIVNQSVTCTQQTCTGAQAPTTLVWSGDTQGTFHDPALLAATLTSSGTPVAGQTVNLAAGAENCAATTDANGVASCLPKPVLGDKPGTVQASASFATTPAYLGSSVAPFDFPVLKAPTTLAYTGPGTVDYDNTVTLTANLTEADNPLTPIGAEPVTFVIADGAGTQSCVTGTTDSSGNVSCTLRVTLVPNNDYTVTAQFAGDDYYVGSNSAGAPFTVNKAPTTLTYGGSAGGNYHDTVMLSGKLTEFDTGSPVAGKLVTFSISAPGQLGCSATTDATG
ncbi:MAG TPA: Ig-like domain-containing protein, partial [Thermoleophilia bacterium]|nr:Ig-like domain-containing protein [Thermoleophilia bacterium]